MLCEVDEITTVLVRPPAILGPGETSIWNTLRPADIRDDEDERHAVPDKTFAWVHLDDLVTLIADVATGRIKTSADPEVGPVEGACTAVNVAAEKLPTCVAESCAAPAPDRRLMPVVPRDGIPGETPGPKPCSRSVARVG